MKNLIIKVTNNTLIKKIKIILFLVSIMILFLAKIINKEIQIERIIKLKESTSIKLFIINISK